MRTKDITDSQIKYMADRFLGWKLPENFNPDGGISFKKAINQDRPTWPQKNEPTGTNVFDADQAEEMVRYMVEGLPAGETASDPACSWCFKRLRDCKCMETGSGNFTVPEPVPPRGAAEDFQHEEDCPCFAEQHSIDCANCECQCRRPPKGWRCTRGYGHNGPCAAVPVDESAAPIAPAAQEIDEGAEFDAWLRQETTNEDGYGPAPAENIVRAMRRAWMARAERKEAGQA